MPHAHGRGATGEGGAGRLPRRDSVCEGLVVAGPPQDNTCGWPACLGDQSRVRHSEAASRAFYTALGFTNNPRFTDDSAAFMVWSESINIMLVTHAKWRTLTTRPIPPNTSASTHGGTADINPVQDHGFMYGRDFADPDGHVRGAVWIDMSAMPSG